MRNALSKIILILAVSQVATAAYAPLGTKGQSQTTPLETSRLQVPNSQATLVGDKNVLLETGNENFLANPGLESATLGQGWTCSGTKSLETVSVKDGKKALTNTEAAAVAECSQSVTPTQDVAGDSWEANVWVKTSSSLLQVCFVINSVDSQCVPVLSDNAWHKYLVTGIAQNAVAHKLSIRSTGAMTGSFTYDDSYLGKSRNIGYSSQAEYIGSITVTGCAAGWSSVSASYTQPAVTTGCVYTSTTSKITAPSTMLPGFNISGPAGKYVVTFTGGFGKSASISYSPSFRMAGFGVFSPEEAVVLGGGTTSLLHSELSGTLITNSAVSNTPVVMQIKSDGTNAGAIYGQTALPGTFKVYRFPLDSEQVLRLGLEDYNFTATRSTPTTLAPNSTIVDIVFNSAVYNPSGAYNATTGEYTAKVSGLHWFRTSINLLATNVLANDYEAYIRKNGSTPIVAGHFNPFVTAAKGLVRTAETAYIYLNAGDTVKPGLYGAGNNSASQVTISADASASYFTGGPVGNVAKSVLVKQSVVSSYDGVTQIAYGTMTNNGSVCSIISQSGSFSSPSRNGTGRCQFNMSGFSATPSCTCTPVIGGVGGCVADNEITLSSTIMGFRTDASGAAADASILIQCIGPR